MKLFSWLKILYYLVFSKKTIKLVEKNKSNNTLEIGLTYRVYWALSVDNRRLSEIDKTIKFFSGDLIAINQRKNGLIINPFEKIYSFSRKGFDTKSGKPYIHKFDILESEIMKLELVG
jgi:hypothetical protein